MKTLIAGALRREGNFDLSWAPGPEKWFREEVIKKFYIPRGFIRPEVWKIGFMYSEAGDLMKVSKTALRKI